jgi:DNA-directed RNA polymerase subunit H (RpoH/RPB5)
MCRGKCDNNDIENQYHHHKGEVVKCKRVSNANDPTTYYFLKTKEGKKMATYTRMWLSTDGETYGDKSSRFNRSKPPSKGDVIKIKKRHSDRYDVYMVV